MFIVGVVEAQLTMYLCIEGCFWNRGSFNTFYLTKGNSGEAEKKGL